MESERNALAELADELDCNHFPHTCSKWQDAALRKAQRILAELANVQEMERMLSEEDNDVPVNVELGIIHSYQTNCINKCRAIAEEGV